ncbi:hypothetical protein QVD17_08834 [Tagetes erecta]|uniref:Uncharacterized protein n=1 Tax=Tagetes erecta TaxID=13708 RepID=A0AAD8P4H0_TARER|nr:hypothetical protein QVD17_08834 [Tagetes erecta]
MHAANRMVENTPTISNPVNNAKIFFNSPKIREEGANVSMDNQFSLFFVGNLNCFHANTLSFFQKFAGSQLSARTNLSVASLDKGVFAVTYPTAASRKPMFLNKFLSVLMFNLSSGVMVNCILGESIVETRGIGGGVDIRWNLCCRCKEQSLVV